MNSPQLNDWHTDVDFDKPCLCPDCGEHMSVSLPVWITPGKNKIETENIDYAASVGDGSKWWCDECGDHHMPLPQVEDNNRFMPTGPALEYLSSRLELHDVTFECVSANQKHIYAQIDGKLFDVGSRTLRGRLDKAWDQCFDSWEIDAAVEALRDAQAGIGRKPNFLK